MVFLKLHMLFLGLWSRNQALFDLCFWAPESEISVVNFDFRKNIRHGQAPPRITT